LGGGFEQAERVRLRLLPDDTAWLLRTRNSLAWCYVRLNRNQDALNALEPLMGPQYSLGNIGALEWQKTRLQYALALANLTRYADAESMLKDSLREVQQVMGENNHITGLVWDYLGEIYQDAGRWSEAIDAHQHAYSIMKASVGENARSTLVVAAELAFSDYLSRGAAQALPKLEAAHASLAGKFGEGSAFTQQAAFYLAAAMVDLDRITEAAQLMEGVDAGSLTPADPGADWAARVSGLKGILLMRQGQVDQGRAQVSEAIARLTAEKAPAWMIQPLQAALKGGAPHSLVRD